MEHVTTRPVLGDAERIPFPDATFDVVYAFGVLHHTPGTAKAINEVQRVLRPGGQAIIALYHRNSYNFWVGTVLFNGVLKGGLWRKGWKHLLSEIEYRSDPNSALPLVKVYSRREVRNLFRQFSRTDIVACHIDPGTRRPTPMLRSFCERFFSVFGWYLVVRATK
jgi:ubiquinone/menaquinone biosynthesis C-methylase UbiE